MKTYKEIDIPAKKGRELVAFHCDLCGRKADGEDWTRGSYVIDETEMRVVMVQREGSSYPEGGSGKEYEIDLCPRCFKERLVPWLISQGAKIEQKEWEW